jgi:hypothetical protein
MKGMHYEITDNFNRILDEFKKPLKMDSTGVNKLKSHAKKLDKRLNVIALAPTMDATCMFNYMSLVSARAEELFQDNNMNHSMTELLDTGFMPLVMLPSFMSMDIVQPLVNIAEDRGLRIYRRRAKRLESGHNIEPGEDIWVSKLDVYKLFNIHPLQASSTELLMRLVQGG